METNSRYLFLVGFSGSGKSTIGPLLAKRLKARFYDTDVMIERTEHRSISEIFVQRGEKYFRKVEVAAIKSVVDGRAYSKVIALGGGALSITKTRQFILKSGLAIYLQCSKAELYKRLRQEEDRPLLHSRNSEQMSRRNDLRDRISRLLDSRKKQYQAAHMRISTTATPIKKSVDEIVKKLERFREEH